MYMRPGKQKKNEKEKKHAPAPRTKPKQYRVCCTSMQHSKHIQNKTTTLRRHSSTEPTPTHILVYHLWQPFISAYCTQRTARAHCMLRALATYALSSARIIRVAMLLVREHATQTPQLSCILCAELRARRETPWNPTVLIPPESPVVSGTATWTLLCTRRTPE